MLILSPKIVGTLLRMTKNRAPIYIFFSVLSQNTLSRIIWKEIPSLWIYILFVVVFPIPSMDLSGNPINVCWMNEWTISLHPLPPPSPQFQILEIIGVGYTEQIRDFYFCTVWEKGTKGEKGGERRRKKERRYIWGIPIFFMCCLIFLPMHVFSNRFLKLKIK